MRQTMLHYHIRRLLLSVEAVPNPLPVTVLLSEHAIAAQFADALASGYLAEQFFYWLPLSVEAWVGLCSSPEYRNADRALALLSRAAPRLALSAASAAAKAPRIACCSVPSHILYIGADI